MADEQLTDDERALVLRMLREARLTLGHRIEQQKSQRRRGLPGAGHETTRLEAEFALLDGAIRKIWRGAL